jgi:hypothetical protein
VKGTTLVLVLRLLSALIALLPIRARPGRRAGHPPTRSDGRVGQARSAVRILRGAEELDAALSRAKTYEHAAQVNLERRLARYRNRASDHGAQVMQLRQLGPAEAERSERSARGGDVAVVSLAGVVR